MRLPQIVTLTGIDDHTDLGALAALAAEFPFVEFGVLLSSSSTGKGRYPSAATMAALAGRAEDLRLSGHLCGALVKALVKDGDLEPAQQLAGPLWPRLSRLQINIKGREHEVSVNATVSALMAKKPTALSEVILQCADLAVVRPLAEGISAAGLKASLLFDRSGGKGELPREWPEGDFVFPCGWAGGLSPSNVAAELARIAPKTKGPFWIDMEGQLRDADRLDLAKCRAVLAAVKSLRTGEP